MTSPTTPPRRIARGGQSIYGAPLGILMLEARFPRIPGDMGNAGTWPFPVLYKVVRGATPERVVLEGARGLLPDFLAAARELVALGAEAITTNAASSRCSRPSSRRRCRCRWRPPPSCRCPGCRRPCRRAGASAW
ncbi:hypothetical protein ACFQY5_05960 [Paeniroseomonas aquatica]|uniref:hypothetical protein n=1 Tax=Paeniroseomonas aquatica TaxID=373043 RepID=UPI003620AA9B